MNRSKKSLACLICALALLGLAQRSRTATADAGNAVSTTDYSAIWLRNVFDLKPAPPPVPVNTEPPPAPPPDVKMTGLTELFHVKRALFMVKQKPEGGKPPPAGNGETSYILAEGERSGKLEVVSIDFRGKTAQVKIDGSLTSINLETNTTPSGGGSMHAGYNQRAAANPMPTPSPYNNGLPPGGSPSTSRMVRPSGTTSDNSGVQPLSQGGYAGGYGASGTPGLSLPGSTSTSASSAQNNAPQPTAEVTAAILAAQQAAAQNQGRIFPPIPPPYDMSNPANQNNQNGSTPGNPPTTTPPPPPGSRTTGNFPALPR